MFIRAAPICFLEGISRYLQLPKLAATLDFGFLQVEVLQHAVVLAFDPSGCGALPRLVAWCEDMMVSLRNDIQGK